jgi:hypothetical protein
LIILQKVPEDHTSGEKKIPQVVTDTVLGWVRREKETGSLADYLERINLSGPSASPETVLVENLIAALREEGRGKKKGYIKRQLVTMKPLCLGLGKVALHTNQMILEKSRERFLELSLLAERMNLHFVSLQASMDMEAIEKNEKKIPFLSDPERTSLHRYLEEESIFLKDDRTMMKNMVREHLVEKGHKLLPYPDNPEWTRAWIKKVRDHEERETLQEIVAMFGNENIMNNFLDGNDNSYGMADVPDTIFEKHLRDLAKEIEELSGEGEIAEGKALVLNDFPIPFLREIPVIDGQWLDLEIAGYLEATGILAENGHTFIPSADLHPFALPMVMSASGEQPEERDVFEEALPRAKEELLKYPWKSCIIRGRQHIPLETYLELERRHWKEDFEIREGLKISSWNKWIRDEEGQEGTALIGKVRVTALNNTGIIGTVLEASEDTAAETARRRVSTMELTEKWRLHGRDKDRGVEKGLPGTAYYSLPYITDTEPVRQRLAQIRSMAEIMAIDLLGTRTAVNWLNQEFFSGENILFPEIGQSIDSAIQTLHQLIETYNTRIASEIEEYLYREMNSEEDATDWKDLFPKGCYISLDTVKEGVLARAREIFTGLSALVS